MKSLSKRQRWVKNAAIVFFVVLLLLTFFSNTIMNYSLAQVATAMVSSETVSTKVRGTGTVEAGAATDVTLSVTRVVTEVLIEDGDSVKAGDVLFKLEEGESAELKTAAAELAALQDAYAYNILTNEMDPSIVAQAEAGGIDYTAATATLASLSNAVDSAQATLTSLQTQLDDLNKSTSAWNTAVTQATEALAQANVAYTAAESAFYAYGYDADTVNAILNGETELPIDQTVQNAKAALDAMNNAQALVDECTTALTNAENALAAEQERLTQAGSNAQAALDAAQSAHDDYLSEINTVKELHSQYAEIQTKQAEYDKLAASCAVTEVTAETDGVVSEIAVSAGDTATPDIALCTIMNASNGYSLQFSVTKQQAAKVSVGDTATISSAWYYSDVTATLKAIKRNAQDTRSRMLVFDIQGEVEVGDTMTLSVGDKSATYDYVVPNSAMREDNNGSFILIIKEKSSPLGNRYVATRVDVDVLASDDANTAVTGALEGYEYVITTSDKLVEAGDYVRLAEQ